MASAIRNAGPVDVPRMVDLSEQKQIEYQGYQASGQDFPHGRRIWTR